MLRTVNMSTKKMAQKEEYKNVKYKMILNNSHVRIIPTQNLKINKFIQILFFILIRHLQLDIFEIVSKTTDKTTEKAAASPKKDSENRRRTIYRPRNRACRYRGRWIRCSQERASWRARAYPIRKNINYS